MENLENIFGEDVDVDELLDFIDECEGELEYEHED